MFPKAGEIVSIVSACLPKRRQAHRSFLAPDAVPGLRADGEAQPESVPISRLLERRQRRRCRRLQSLELAVGSLGSLSMRDRRMFRGSRAIGSTPRKKGSATRLPRPRSKSMTHQARAGCRSRVSAVFQKSRELVSIVSAAGTCAGQAACEFGMIETASCENGFSGMSMSWPDADMVRKCYVRSGIGRR